MRSETTKVIQFDEAGTADVLKLVEVPIAEPASDEVRIRVKAVSLNRADALFRKNTYVLAPTLPASRIGTDAAGIVEAVGSDVKEFKVGDRVVSGLGFEVSKYGVHGETAILPSKHVSKYPDFLTPEEAASFSIPYITAWGALIDQGQMSEGDYVLITAASSSVGVAAIQLANAVGAIPIAMTRNPSKKQGLMDAGATDVIVTSKEDLAGRVGEITGGRGARLIFDAVGKLEDLAAAAATNGIVFLYGRFGDGAVTLPILPTMMKELCFRGYVVYSVYQSPDRLARARRSIHKGLRSGSLKVMIDRVFSLERYADSHRYLESNEQIGRIVVKV